MSGSVHGWPVELKFPEQHQWRVLAYVDTVEACEEDSRHIYFVALWLQLHYVCLIMGNNLVNNCYLPLHGQAVFQQECLCYPTCQTQSWANISAIHALHSTQMCENVLQRCRDLLIVLSTIVGCGSKSRAWGWCWLVMHAQCAPHLAALCVRST